MIFRSSRPEVYLRKGVLKIFSKLTGEHPCRSAISIKLHSNFIEIAFRYGCSPVNLLHIFRTPFLKNCSKGLLLKFAKSNYQLAPSLSFHSQQIQKKSSKFGRLKVGTSHNHVSAYHEHRFHETPFPLSTCDYHLLTLKAVGVQVN